MRPALNVFSFPGRKEKNPMEFSWEGKSPFRSTHFSVVKSVKLKAEISSVKRFGGQGSVKSPAPKSKDENPEQELGRKF